MGDERAIWRTMDGAEVFTGLVLTNDNEIKRLDDPRGALCGPGHVASETELLSQFALYDESSMPRLQVPIECRTFTNKELTAEDIGFMENAQPFPDSVRAEDLVALAATHQRFWARVLSVTPCGKVTVFPLSPLDMVPSNTPILVSIKAVMAARRGANW